MKTTIVIIIVLFLFSCATENSPTFDIQQIQKSNNQISVVENGVGFEGNVLKITPTNDDQSLTIWEGTDPDLWKNAKYLICEIWHDNDFSAVLNVEFFRNERGAGNIVTQSGTEAGDEDGTPRMSAKIGVLPKLKTKMVFPLEHLNGQEIFMRRFPRQLKGTVLGDRMKPEETSKVILRFGPWMEPHFMPEFEVAAVYLTNEEPEPFSPVKEPVVDKFGQWTVKDWPGKTKNEQELETLLEGQLASAQTITFPENWSKYGGWKERKFEATGFFRTHNDGNRWWLVDPEGYVFVSVGVDCIRYTASGVSSGQEDLFAWLPDENDELYKDGISGRGEHQQVDFYKFNLMRVFGEKWRENWETITSGQIREFGINTIGNWSDVDYARKSGIPYVLPLSRFPSTKVLLYRDFPDVFAEEYENNAKEFALQLNEYKNDSYLIGYFLRNEPNWAFGAHDIAFEMFATTQPSESKNTFAKWLSVQYASVDELNSAWNLDLPDFETLTQQVFDDYPSEKAKGDFWEFSEILVAKYVNVPCDEVEKVDPNHLNLGMRYAWLSSDLLYKAGERFDVFSINGYGNPGPPETAEIAEISGKPVMIGEFHFGATDRGLPATGIQGALSQSDRGKAYRYYIEQGLARPELIGMHYFQWLDQPVFGRFDGENYNIGLMDICNNPYKELIEAVKQTHQKMYEVASGTEQPFNEIIEKIPPIHY
ncbi:glycoside hydrolase 5 family protein [Maribellus maritimus]|uniref:beta-galactosidase n=1 Tax=Maribellus maritimus TaxID=2870838 RepID=UPI001EEB8B93|nr:beta-galactosidase [Maribellus maritimus]MCG6187311.1 beta-galactosidase [Maribellus maritimus]